MENKDKDEYIRRYTNRLNIFGYSPETLGWGKNGRQDVRFNVLSEFVLKNNKLSVLDVGCGFADLYGFLKQRGWSGKYTGIDLVPKIVEVGRELHPEITLIAGDIANNNDIEPHDFVISSGIFNTSLTEQDNYLHIQKTLQIMFNHANLMVCADFLSSNVDFKKDIAWHSEPEKIVQIVTEITPRYSIRHDYMPYEFAVFLFKNNNKTDVNTYPSIF